MKAIRTLWRTEEVEIEREVIVTETVEQDKKFIVVELDENDVWLLDTVLGQYRRARPYSFNRAKALDNYSQHENIIQMLKKLRRAWEKTSYDD